MNQVTNRVPYGLLSEEEQAQLSAEAKNRGMYELYWSGGWSESITDMDFVIDGVYRLIIKDDEWYYWGIGTGGAIIAGKDIEHQLIINSLDILRLATPAEIQAAQPKVESLEDRVKAEYGDYEVVMLEWSRINVWSIQSRQGLVSHAIAQSMKGFYRYVYENPEPDKSLCHLIEPVWLCDYEPILPIAVLFTKDNN